MPDFLFLSLGDYMATQTRGANVDSIACRHLGALLEACYDRQVNLAELTEDTGCSIGALKNPWQRLPWSRYQILAGRIKHHLDTPALIKIGQRVCHASSAPLVGRLLFSLADSYHHAFNDHGAISRNFPCQAHCRQQGTNQLLITLQMHAGLSHCPLLPDLLTGELLALAPGPVTIARRISADMIEFTVELSWRARTRHACCRWWQPRQMVQRLARQWVVQPHWPPLPDPEGPQHPLRETRQQRHRQQRMAALGQFTGGIAHDFNNLLVSINGYAALCQKPTLSSADRTRYLAHIHQAGQMAAQLTRQLLSFSRPARQQTQWLDMNQLIAELQPLLESALPAHIDLTIDTCSSPAPLLIEPARMEQVIMNLVTNARDALSEPGRITIHTRLIETPVSGLPSRTELELSIRDTGVGIATDKVAEVMTPYFTTKSEGTGTGLGLAVVKEIVDEHAGTIELQTRSGLGTCIKTRWPLAALHSTPTAQQHRSTLERTRRQGGETVLLVEPNALVRDFAEQVLHAADYRVLAAVDGMEARAMFANRYHEIALVIMEAVLPKLTSQQLLRQMQDLQPALAVLFTSGYACNSQHTAFIHHQGLPFLAKPYSSEALCGHLDRLLTS